MKQRPWVPVYEMHSEDSGYEHINPNVVLAVNIESVEQNDLFDTIIVAVTAIGGDIRYIEFSNIKEAHRFINRMSEIV